MAVIIYIEPEKIRHHFTSPFGFKDMAIDKFDPFEKLKPEVKEWLEEFKVSCHRSFTGWSLMFVCPDEDTAVLLKLTWL